MNKQHPVMLKELNPGTMFRRVAGEFRYIVSDKREETYSGNVSIYCYNIDGESEGYNHPGSEMVIPMQVKSTQQFWVCQVEGSKEGTYRHYSLIKAMNEAERLAKLTGRRVFVNVQETVGSVIYLKPVPCTEYQWKWED